VGHSKAEAERLVLDTDPRALVIRTSALFGPWDARNFVTRSLNTLRAGQPLMAASDLTVSPTYVPDLVHACLDLLIDKEAGVWHLSSGQALSWAELAAKTCLLAQIDAGSLEALPWAQLGHIAPRPANSALSSEKEILLPELDDALARYLLLSAPFSQQDYSRQTAYNGCQ
jgi:dTDP-4-dehydrorhamnose reductase